MHTNEREIIIEHALDLEDKKNLEMILDIIATKPKLKQIIKISLEKSGKSDFVDDIQSWYSLDPGLRKSIIKTVVENSSDRTFEQNDSENVIIEHALENEKNLEIALDIIFAYTDLRQRITNNFREKLQVFLKNKKKLTESQFKWQFEWEGDFQEVLGVTSKAEDLPEVRIWINPNSETDRFIGIHVESLKPSLPAWNPLKSKLEAKLKKGSNRKNPYWIWKTPNWKYKDWTDKDNLIKMHTEEAVKDVGNYFLEIVIEAEPLINEWWVKENAHNG